MGMAVRIEPTLVIQPDRIDDKSISFPLADGIAHPCRFQIFGMTPSVGPDLPPDALVLEEHENAVRSLNDFKWLGPDQNSRDAGRIAVQNRVITFNGGFRAVARLRGIVPRLRPGRHRRRSCTRATI